MPAMSVPQPIARSLGQELQGLHGDDGARLSQILWRLEAEVRRAPYDLEVSVAYNHALAYAGRAQDARREAQRALGLVQAMRDTPVLVVLNVAGALLDAGLADETEALLPAPWFEVWKAEALASDPVGARQVPPVVRSPAGVRQDLHELWGAGRPTYDPGAIAAPTLLVTGAWDGITPPAQAQAVFDALGSRTKRFVQVGGATHLLMLERNRMQLFREVQLFLEAPVAE